jgi:hypothetical protein
MTPGHITRVPEAGSRLPSNAGWATPCGTPATVRADPESSLVGESTVRSLPEMRPISSCAAGAFVLRHVVVTRARPCQREPLHTWLPCPG